MQRIYNLRDIHYKTIEYIIANPRATNMEVAEVMGVSYQSISNWRCSDVFKEHLNKRLKEEWSESTKIAQKTIIDAAADGNIVAAKYILDSAGYGPDQNVNVNMNTIKVDIIDD